MNYRAMTTGRMLTGWDGNHSNPTVIPRAAAGAPPVPGAETDVLASGPSQQGGDVTIGVAGFGSVLLSLCNMYTGAGVSTITFRIYGNILPEAGTGHRELLSTVAGITKGSFHTVNISSNAWNNIEITAQETTLVAEDSAASVIVFCHQAY